MKMIVVRTGKAGLNCDTLVTSFKIMFLSTSTERHKLLFKA
jgi:hypothetical protein